MIKKDTAAVGFFQFLIGQPQVSRKVAIDNTVGYHWHIYLEMLLFEFMGMFGIPSFDFEQSNQSKMVCHRMDWFRATQRITRTSLIFGGGKKKRNNNNNNNR